MNRQMTKLAILSAAAVATVALLSIPLLADEKQHQQGSNTSPTVGPVPAKYCGMQDKEGCTRGKHHGMHKMCVARLDQAIKAIDAATKAVEKDQKAAALVELKKAKEVVASCLKTMSEMGKTKIVNTSCPIMGTKLDPEKVPQNLTRMYMGRKVGFCCAGCPQQWDKLSPDEKAKKLGRLVPAKTVPGTDSDEKHPHGH